MAREKQEEEINRITSWKEQYNNNNNNYYL